jgi:hypothetical protein
MIYLGALCVQRILPQTLRRSVPIRMALFIVLYAAAWPAVGALAAATGRVPLPCGGDGALRVALPHIGCVLHRHYVSPALMMMLEAMAEDVSAKFPGTRTLLLDANFPFLDGFPMLPHLSHDDGHKADLAFYYAHRDGAYARGQIASPFGYWAFVDSGEQLVDFGPPLCPEDMWPTLRWDMDWLQPLMRRDLVLEESRNEALLEWVVTHGQEHGLGKLLVEPRVSIGLGFEGYGIIAFQGCSAARHDDHMHVQLR